MKLKKLERKGLDFPVNIQDPISWKKTTDADPNIPSEYSQLRQLTKTLFSTEHLNVSSQITGARDSVPYQIEECGEEVFYRFSTGLGNPFLTPDQREEIEGDMDTYIPVLNRRFETEHFTLKWTDESKEVVHNIPDPLLVEETGQYLEIAWNKFNELFGRSPYISEGNQKIEVIFQYLIVNGVSSPPDGPLQFNSKLWVDNPLIRQSVTAHELFHRMQYSFGYRTRWTAEKPYKWFSEGTASWAEAFVWQRVSSASKITSLFQRPDAALFESDYSSLPFWIFFQTRINSSNRSPISILLENFESSGNLMTALSSSIQSIIDNKTYEDVGSFFALFSYERMLGTWNAALNSNQTYAAIYDADGNALKPQLFMRQVELGSEESYTNSERVANLGSDYYHLKLKKNTDGNIFKVSISGSTSDNLIFYVIRAKGNSYMKSQFSVITGNKYEFKEEIKLNIVESFIVIVSSIHDPTDYVIEVSVTNSV